MNDTTRFRRSWTQDDVPVELYCQLVASYGGGYHAYLESDDWAVACGSPELFFERSSGCLARRPMKGTAARGRWSADDACRGEALRTSPKERAENVMVVDLMRNDLGRIAVPGTVEVPALWFLEQHPTLWQLTSTVTATTPADLGLAEVFGALFPSASVTGAPKISAMSVIADLEPSSRGVYCGAVGFLAPPTGGSRGRPSARFAVAIRTAVVDKARNVAEYGSGGGITWDSIEDQEWTEVLLKARALAGPSASALPGDEGLIETMAFEPDIRGGTVRNLGGHLARLTASALYFGVLLRPETEELIAKAVTGLSTPARVRLILRADGTVEIETSELDLEEPADTLRLCIDPEPVPSTEVMLFHKTTNRRRYDERARRHPVVDDVVLVNERGEVTETTLGPTSLCAWAASRALRGFAVVCCPESNELGGWLTVGSSSVSSPWTIFGLPQPSPPLARCEAGEPPTSKRAVRVEALLRSYARLVRSGAVVFAPTVILSNDGANLSASRLGRGIVTVVPITSNVRNVYAFQVLLRSDRTGLRRHSKAQAEQIRSVAVERIGSMIGTVPVPEMAQIDGALRLYLGL